MSSKHFCLKWTKFQTSILSAFESLQSTEDLADVTLTCDGMNIKAHKFILSACSPYFRTIFKENPCPHPIVILKDVAYVDLIAVVNFMYHGEVLVSEEQLSSFLQTAMILQVSGLINETPCSLNRQPTAKKKLTGQESVECPLKKIRVSSKASKSDEMPQKLSENVQKPIVESKEILRTDVVNVKTETIEGNEEEEDEDVVTDTGKSEDVGEIHQGSILEAALEVKDKPSSILERSLLSHPTPGKPPTVPPPFPTEKPSLLQILPDIAIPKTIFIPRKPPEGDTETKVTLRSSSESSSTSPSGFERPSEFLQQTIKIEGEHLEHLSSDDAPNNTHSRPMEAAPPHHSSQCGNCPHCGKVYSNQSALKYHVRLVHSDLTNMYCCHLCPESFDYREGYKKHMAEAHSIRN